MSSGSEESAPPPASVFRLVAPSRLRSAIGATVAILVIVVPMLAFLAVFQVGRLEMLDPKIIALLLALMVGVPLVVLWVAIMTRKTGEPLIELQPNVALLPTDSTGSKRAAVPYTSIESADLRTQSRFAFVVVRAGGRMFTYAARSFSPPEQAAHFIEALRARIASTPGGAARLAEMDRQLELSSAMSAKRPVATYVLLLLIAAGFAIELLSGALNDPPDLALVRLGANAASLIREGQVFRLVSANFLHGGVLHIVLNGVALWSVGGLIERLIGPWAFLVIYLASGIGGALASAAFGHAALSIGASTAIFGLLGCLATASLHFGGRMPEGYRQSRAWWITTIAVNASLPIIVPVIDAIAHLGGFITGALALYPLIHGESIDEDGIRTTPLAKWVAIALGAIYVAGIGLAVDHASRTSAVGEETFIASIANDPDANPIVLNDLAFVIAKDPNAQGHVLDLASKAAIRAHEKKVKGVERNGCDERTVDLDWLVADTLATVDYRLGELDDAVKLERKVLAEHNDRFIATQLARFLRAAVQKNRRPLGPPDAEAVAKLESVVSPNGQRAIAIELSGLDGKCAQIELLATSSRALYGLVQFGVGPLHDRRVAFDLDPERSRTWPVEITLSHASTSTVGCDLEGDAKKITVWDADPAALGLP